MRSIRAKGSSAVVSNVRAACVGSTTTRAESTGMGVRTCGVLRLQAAATRSSTAEDTCLTSAPDLSGMRVASASGGDAGFENVAGAAGTTEGFASWPLPALHFSRSVSLA